MLLMVQDVYSDIRLLKVVYYEDNYLYFIVDDHCKADFPYDPLEFTVQCNGNRNPDGTYPVKTICRFRCKDKYVQSSGNNIILCKSDGRWSGSTIKCEGECNFHENCVPYFASV